MYTYACTYIYAYMYPYLLMCLHICTYVLVTLYTTISTSIMSHLQVCVFFSLFKFPFPFNLFFFLSPSHCLLVSFIIIIISSDKMKRSFFQAAVVSILLYGCTTWTLTKRLEKKLDGNYTRMLRAILNKSWQQHPTRRQLYGHLPPITKTIQARRTRHAGHCWRSKDEIVSDVLLWTPAYSQSKAGRPARTFIQQLCDDTGCNPEDLPEAMNDRETWRERVRDIRASRTSWWWWWFVPFNLCDLKEFHSIDTTMENSANESHLEISDNQKSRFLRKQSLNS